MAESPKVPKKKQEREKGKTDPNRKLRGGKKDGEEKESKLRMVEEIEKKRRKEGDKEKSKQKKVEKRKEVPRKNERKKNRTGNRHRWAGAEGTKAEENQR